MSLTEWAQVELLLMLHQNQHAMNVKGWLNGLANINQTGFTKISSTNPAHFWMWLQHCRKFSWQLKSLFTLPLWSMSLTEWAQVELLLMLHQNQHAMNVKGWLNRLANINQTGFTKSSSTNPAHFWMWLQHCRKFSWQLKSLFTLPLWSMSPDRMGTSGASFDASSKSTCYECQRLIEWIGQHQSNRLHQKLSCRPQHQSYSKLKTHIPELS